MRDEIPSEQLEKIRPNVEAVLERLRALTERLSPEVESAMVFDATGGEKAE